MVDSIMLSKVKYSHINNIHIEYRDRCEVQLGDDISVIGRTMQQVCKKVSISIIVYWIFLPHL